MVSPKVVVLGAGGMLGHKMFQHLHSVFPGTVGITRGGPVSCGYPGAILTGVDADDFEDLASTLRLIRPDFLVNCIGIIKQRAEAQDPVRAIAINALLPHRLAALASLWGGRLIHFSTDCVFSGARGPYREEDTSDACDLYGRTKYLGEVQTGNALTLRTSIIGRELSGRRSLLEWFLSQNGGTVHGFRRVIWSGVTTNHAAWLVGKIIRNHSSLSGLYQMAGRPICKHDLLCLLREAYSRQIEIVPDEKESSDRSMSGEKLRQAIGYTAPAWAELIQELASDPTPYESWLQK
jgi:dTDP-4-dehydrorhamnose reductase